MYVHYTFNITLQTYKTTLNKSTKTLLGLHDFPVSQSEKHIAYQVVQCLTLGSLNGGPLLLENNHKSHSAVARLVER